MRGRALFASGTSRRQSRSGNVVEDPLGDRIADGGNPGRQGQVSTEAV
jgi:hypothetical protein